MKKQSKLVMMVLLGFIVFFTVLPVFAGGGQESADTGPENLKFGYVCKMLTNPWFIEEEAGIESKCDELGIDFISVDANLDDEACMQGVESMLARGVDALMLVVTDTELGPTIIDSCDEAGVALLTIDDPIFRTNGEQIPHVGMPTTEIGEMGGEALAKMAKERGFFEAGNNVKVMSVTVSFKPFLIERTQGYHKALIANTPLTEDDIIMEDNETGMFEQVLPVASALLNSNPDVTHWIITGINDDTTVACFRVLEEAGFNMNNVIGCGLGGYSLSYEEFEKGNDNYITSKLQPFKHGTEAVRVLHEYLTEGKEMPIFTKVLGEVVTIDNYKNYDW
jgi:L-arabinose transport system substrate-binding protein